MSDEYKMLRTETMECIDKQDTLSNIVFTVLGASSVYSTTTENIHFIILIELISAVLLARILHYRHVMLYTSTYLERLEETGKSDDISWQLNLNRFHERTPQVRQQWDFPSKILSSIVKIARLSKHLGNMILSIYLFFPIFSKVSEMVTADGSHITLDYPTFFAFVALILNIVFSLAICFLYKLRPGYRLVWADVVSNSDTTGSDTTGSDTTSSDAK